MRLSQGGSPLTPVGAVAGGGWGPMSATIDGFSSAAVAAVGVGGVEVAESLGAVPAATAGSGFLPSFSFSFSGADDVATAAGAGSVAGVAVGTSVPLCPGSGIALGGVEGFLGSVAPDGCGVVEAKSSGAAIEGEPAGRAAWLLTAGFPAVGVASGVLLSAPSLVAFDQGPKSHTINIASTAKKRMTPKMHSLRFSSRRSFFGDSATGRKGTLRSGR
jgi:hypothetical protein